MSTYRVPMRSRHGLAVGPTTGLGRWAVITAVASGVGWLVALPAIAFAPAEGAWVPWGLLLLFGLVPGIACAVAAPILASLAMVRRGERAPSVWLAYVPVASMLLGSAINSLFFT